MTSTLTKPASNDSLEFAKLDVFGRLDAIEANLLKQDPMLGVHMQEIHKCLLQNEELVHILPDEKIHIYMAGMQKYKQLQLVAESTKKRSTGRGGKPDAEEC